MVNIVGVGPPLSGMADLKSVKADSGDDQFKATSSFADALKQKTLERNDVKGKNKDVAEKDGPRYERAEGEIKEKVPSLGITTKKNQLAREKEIQKFMDSFESEFGISPTRIVEAMAQLKNESLQKPAEVTAEDFISSLGLDEENQDKAKEMYMGFLLNLQTIEQSPRAPIAVPVNPDNLLKAQTTERFVASQGKKDAMQNSLSTLNDRFWMKAPSVPVSAPIGPNTEISPQQRALTVGDLLRDQENTLAVSTPLAAASIDGQDEMKILEEELGPEVLKQMDPADLQRLVKELRTIREQNQRVQNLRLNTETSVGAQAMLANRQQQGAAQDLASVNSSTKTQGMPLADVSAQVKAPAPVPQAASAMTEMAKPVKEFFPANQSSMNSNQQQFSQGKENLKSADVISKKKSDLSSTEAVYGSGLGLTAMKPLDASVQNLHGEMSAVDISPKEKQENIQQIMNQAQYLIKKGGGEMKVKLSPEGLGDMHLKVMVENGKVNLQMATESNEAKKLFESSVSDLKNSLSAHKLSFDHIKIDVVNSTSTDVATRQDSNNTNSQSQYQGQKETRQFWNQFQEQFGSRAQRDNFFDVPNLKGYGQKKRDAMEPLTEAQRPRRADGRGNAIDVVA